MRRGETPTSVRSRLALLAVCAVLLTVFALSAAAPDDSPGLPMLPSGLPLVSTAAAGRDAIAIDAIGGLFASHDAGKSWSAVARQWRGRAVKVRLAGAASGFAAPSFGAKKSVRAGAALAVFELVNDANAVWASVDGVNWMEE